MENNEGRDIQSNSKKGDLAAHGCACGGQMVCVARDVESPVTLAPVNRYECQDCGTGYDYRLLWADDFDWRAAGHETDGVGLATGSTTKAITPTSSTSKTTWITCTASRRRGSTSSVRADVERRKAAVDAFDDFARAGQNDGVSGAHGRAQHQPAQGAGEALP